jgi:hypothetical protein
MKRRNAIQFAAAIAIPIMAIFAGCVEEKCYTCTKSGNYPYEVVQPVCGHIMRKYYQDIGYYCYENSQSASIMGPTSAKNELAKIGADTASVTEDSCGCSK